MANSIEVDMSHHVIHISVGGKVTRTIRAFSTGRHGHPTPTGTFHINRRDKDHKSTIYPPPHGGAPMPYAQFFAPAVAFHEGSTRAQSHGCIHLSHSDAEWLWNWVGDDKHVAVHITGGGGHHVIHPHQVPHRKHH